MLKKRKDGSFDEREKGAKELNQTKGFFGGILGFLAIFKGRRELKNINNRIDKRKNADPRFKKAWDNFENKSKKR
jgi:hypothetical protein